MTMKVIHIAISEYFHDQNYKNGATGKALLVVLGDRYSELTHYSLNANRCLEMQGLERLTAMGL